SFKAVNSSKGSVHVASWSMRSRMRPLMGFITLLVATAATFSTNAQTVWEDPIGAWLLSERGRIEKRVIEDRDREDRTKATLRRAQAIQAKASNGSDAAVREVAERAVETARLAL